ncbi:putative carboxylesterase 18 [Wolffia australiana]
MSFENLFPSVVPLKTNIKLSLLSVALNAVRRRDGTLNRSLASLVEFNTAPNPSPVKGVRTDDFIVDPARQLWFRLFLPDAPAPAPLTVMVFFHGGGFAFLSPAKQEYDLVCRRFCSELGVAIISVNYRLAPEHRYPAPYEDGVDVLRFLESTKGHPSESMTSPSEANGTS